MMSQIATSSFALGTLAPDLLGGLNPISALPSNVILHKFPHLSGPYFPHLQDGDNNIPNLIA